MTRNALGGSRPHTAGRSSNAARFGPGIRRASSLLKAWHDYRDDLLRMAGPGRRPWIWWIAELGIKRPPRTPAEHWRYIRLLGLYQDEDEREIIESGLRQLALTGSYRTPRLVSWGNGRAGKGAYRRRAA